MFQKQERRDRKHSAEKRQNQSNHCKQRYFEGESFSHEWTKYPASPFEPDDQGYVMRKGNKADYVVAMKSQFGDAWVEEDYLPPDGNMLLVDAMAFIHRQQVTGCKKFLNMATRYLHDDPSTLVQHGQLGW